MFPIQMNESFIRTASRFLLPCIDNADNSTSEPDGQSNFPVRISSFSCNTNKYLQKEQRADSYVNLAEIFFFVPC